MNYWKMVVEWFHGGFMVVSWDLLELHGDFIGNFRRTSWTKMGPRPGKWIGTTMNLGPDIYGARQHSHKFRLKDIWDVWAFVVTWQLQALNMTGQTVCLQVLKPCSQTCNFKVWGQIWDHLVALVKNQRFHQASVLYWTIKGKKCVKFARNGGRTAQNMRLWPSWNDRTFWVYRWTMLDPCNGSFNEQWTI